MRMINLACGCFGGPWGVCVVVCNSTQVAEGGWEDTSKINVVNTRGMTHGTTLITIEKVCFKS